MAKTNPKPALPHERRIIARPRLLDALDRAARHTILVVSAAGFGKTTLLRQWTEARDAVWYTATLADADVAALARHLAAVLSRESSDALRRIEEVLKVVTHPARSPDDVARALLVADGDSSPRARIIIDNYEKIAGVAPAERVIELIHESEHHDLVVASRVRPTWATARRFIYGEVIELGTNELAFTADEAADVLRSTSAPPDVLAQARGWPAVIALLAATESVPTEPPAAVSSILYSFLADEILNRAPFRVRATLFDLALRAESGPHALEVRDRAPSRDALARAVATGLAHVEQDRVTLHPLARSLLLERLSNDPSEQPRVQAAIDESLNEGNWDGAFVLIRSFNSATDMDRLLTESFRDLLHDGRIATLESFARSAVEHFNLSLPVVELIEAEVAFRDGRLDAARALAASAARRIPRGHPLAARAPIIGALAALLLFDFDEALSLFTSAAAMATDRSDTVVALWGQCQACIFLERPEMKDVAERVAAMAVTPEEHVRAAMSQLQIARYHGLGGVDQHAAVRALLPHVRDPKTRTSFGNLCGYIRILQGRYGEARAIVSDALEDVARYELSFARPHLLATQAAAALGLREFSVADSLLREVEEHAEHSGDVHSDLNSRVLRARLLLAQHRSAEAVAVLPRDSQEHADRLMAGEYIATRALALAVAGERDAAVLAAKAAAETTAGVEARVTVLAATAVANVDAPEADDAAAALFAVAAELDVWDPFVTAVRAVPDVLRTVGRDPTSHALLTRLLRRSSDHALARRCGVALSSPYGRQDILSKREHEVFQLLRQGLTNREIARTLYISESTAKVHVRHILNKLNVRSRAEAVARYTEIAVASGGATDGSNTSETRSS